MDDGGEASYVVDMQDQIVGGGGGEVVLMDHHPLIMTSSSSDAKEEEKSGVVKFLIEQKLQKVSSWPSDYGMYKVPKTLMNENPEAYIPHTVSIGPFYHGQQHLQPMESHKMSYFKKFLDRKPTLFDFYVEAMTNLEERAYQCYPDDANKIERNKFVMMMVVDGCFILELLLRHCEEDKRSKTLSDAKWKWNYLVTPDLLLLENQLPIFVLEALYKVFINGDDDDSQEAEAEAAAAAKTWSLHGHMFNYLFSPAIKLEKKEKINSSYHKIQQLELPASADKPKHLLDFVRKFLIQPELLNIFLQPPPLPEETYKNKNKCSLDFVPAACGLLCLGLGDDRLGQEDPNSLLMKDESNVPPIRCATELEKASVKLKSKKQLTSLTAINFDHNNGELTLPGTVIDNRSEVVLRNLIAYEQYTDDHSYITEYVAFLDGLIDSTQDVELLQKNGILRTIYGNRSEVVRLFRNLLKGVAVPLDYTIPVRLKVEEYYDKRCHRWKASLMLNYFNTPWSFISVVAAIILLSFTVAQTIYAALSYHY